MALWRAQRSPLVLFRTDHHVTMSPRDVGSLKSEMPEMPGVNIKLSAS
jgi:hypothetical protein